MRWRGDLKRDGEQISVSNWSDDNGDVWRAFPNGSNYDLKYFKTLPEAAIYAQCLTVPEPELTEDDLPF